MPSLKELDLSDNKLITDAIDGPIFDLPNLKILNLSKNKLSLLDNRLLNSLNRLQRLDVSHNGISSVSESAFHGVGRLDYLNISHNNLRELKPKTFKGISKLIEFPKGKNPEHQNQTPHKRRYKYCSRGASSHLQFLIFYLGFQRII